MTVRYIFKLFLAAITAATAATANAVPAISVEVVGASPIVVYDNAAGDESSKLGVVKFGADDILGWDISAKGHDHTIVPNVSHMDTYDISSANGGTVIVKFSDSGYQSSSEIVRILAGLGGFSSGNAQLYYDVFVDDTNALFGEKTKVGGGWLDLGLGGIPAVNFGAEVGPMSGPFSLTLVVALKHAGAASTSINFGAKVPEPGSLALLGLALTGITLTLRQRRRSR